MDLFTLVIIIMIAAVIWLRLKSVLGQHGEDDPFGSDQRPSNGRQSHPRQTARDGARGSPFEVVEGTSFKDFPAHIRNGLQSISRRDSGFSIGSFIAGATEAYGMILGAFWGGDIKGFSGFLSADVAAQFDAAIDDRARLGQVVENRLVETSDSVIEAASLDGDNAEITVKFISEIVALVRGDDGEVVEGDMTDTIRVTDIWTFARKIPSSDPNWVLIETRAG